MVKLKRFFFLIKHTPSNLGDHNIFFLTKDFSYIPKIKYFLFGNLQISKILVKLLKHLNLTEQNNINANNLKLQFICLRNII